MTSLVASKIAARGEIPPKSVAPGDRHIRDPLTTPLTMTKQYI